MKRAAALLFLAALFAGCTGEETPRPPQLLVDVTDQSGIDFVHVHGGSGRKYLPETMGAGGCVLDLDADGFMDVYLVQSGGVPGAPYEGPAVVNRLYRNRGDGTFEDVTERSGTGDGGYGQGAVCADYDNDGDPDIYVVNFGPNVMLQNNGDGTFEDVTGRAGVGDALWGSSAAFFDAEPDGDLDLYVANYVDFTVATHVECGKPSEGRVSYCHPDAYPMAPDVFYRNRGDGTFEDATTTAGFIDTVGKGLGVVAFDFDDDGDTDIYVANDATPNFLFENLGDGTFDEIGLFVGVGYNEEGLTEAGMGTDAGDVDGDGRFDIFVTNLSRETNALYLREADSFSYATRHSGLHKPSYPENGFGTDLLDLDNDGDLDIFVANGHVTDNIELVDDSLSWKQPSQVFLNDGADIFTMLDPQNLEGLAVPRVARGSMTLDYDNDGRLDLLVMFNNDRARLFRNVFEPPSGWIGFDLERGVGARVTVETSSGTMMDEVKAGSSYLTSSDPRLHFGLGADEAALRVTVRWPDGATKLLERIAGGQYYRVGEDADR